MELFIIETLLNGRNVEIPDFGHLELKSLGDRRTVLFKSTDNSDSFLHIMTTVGEKEKKDADILNKLISTPLKEGKIVNLPQIGIFRPVKRENGKIHVSFIPSSSLRKLLNEEVIVKKKEIKKIENIQVIEDVVEIEKMPDVPEIKNEVRKGEIATEKIASVTGNVRKIETARAIANGIATPKNKSHSTPQRKISHVVSDTVESQNKSSAGKKQPQSKMRFLLLVATVMAIIVTGALIWAIYRDNNKPVTSTSSTIIGGQTDPILSSASIDLPELAKQHYGHPAFWIYIYQSNLNKIKSPINIPQNTSLVIPDLKKEYDVDVTDSMEIQRAKILTDMILKEKFNESNNK